MKIIEKFYNSQPVLIDNSISPHHCAGFQTRAVAYHMENTVGISNFSKHKSDEEIMSNESPNPYTYFQRHQTKSSGESRLSCGGERTSRNGRMTESGKEQGGNRLLWPMKPPGSYCEFQGFMCPYIGCTSDGCHVHSLVHLALLLMLVCAYRRCSLQLIQKNWQLIREKEMSSFVTGFLTGNGAHTRSCPISEVGDSEELLYVEGLHGPCRR